MDLRQIQQAIETLPGSERKALAKWLRKGSRGESKTRVSDERVFYRSTALLWTVLSIAAFLLAEGAIFRLGWYNKYLEPDSSAGNVELFQFWLRRTPPAGNMPEVMVVGDSRIAEGFSARTAEDAAGNKVRFWNFGIGGTTPRVWYYELRDGDPTRRRFAALVIPLDPYADEDRRDAQSTRLTDLSFLIGRLRVSDCADFAFSMGLDELRDRALRGCLLRGITLRRDVQELVLHTADRLKRAKEWRENGLGYIDGYAGSDENLHGLSADFTRRTIVFPPGLNALRHKTVQDMVMPDPTPQTGETTRYRNRWLGRILDLYKDSPTRIVFLELPRAPLPTPESGEPARFLQAALKRPRVSALPSSTFRDLENPDDFFDGLHLNKIGRGIFSARLAREIAPSIGVK